MSQYINLLDTASPARASLPAAKHVAWAAGLLAVTLVAIAVPIQQQTRRLDTEAREIGAQIQAQRERLTALGKQAAARQVDPSLARDLAQAEALLALRREAVAALQTDAFGDKSGVSAYLQAFARQSLDGLWLTGFEIGSGGELSISGRALDPALLPQYIRRLNAEELFRSRSFAALRIHDGSQGPQPAATRSEGRSPVEFELSSTASAAGGAKP